MATYNVNAAGRAIATRTFNVIASNTQKALPLEALNKTLTLRIVFPSSAPPPTQGQLWPRGN